MWLLSVCRYPNYPNFLPLINITICSPPTPCPEFSDKTHMRAEAPALFLIAFNEFGSKIFTSNHWWLYYHVFVALLPEAIYKTPIKLMNTYVRKLSSCKGLGFNHIV